MITLEGIVLKERSVGEQDKFIDILTKEKGLIDRSPRLEVMAAEDKLLREKRKDPQH